MRNTDPYCKAIPQLQSQTSLLMNLPRHLGLSQQPCAPEPVDPGPIRWVYSRWVSCSDAMSHHPGDDSGLGKFGSNDPKTVPSLCPRWCHEADPVNQGLGLVGAENAISTCQWCNIRNDAGHRACSSLANHLMTGGVKPNTQPLATSMFVGVCKTGPGRISSFWKWIFHALVKNELNCFKVGLTSMYWISRPGRSESHSATTALEVRVPIWIASTGVVDILDKRDWTGCGRVESNIKRCKELSRARRSHISISDNGRNYSLWRVFETPLFIETSRH